jgi:hypothetical protein
MEPRLIQVLRKGVPPMPLQTKSSGLKASVAHNGTAGTRGNIRRRDEVRRRGDNRDSLLQTK